MENQAWFLLHDSHLLFGKDPGKVPNKSILFSPSALVNGKCACRNAFFVGVTMMCDRELWEPWKTPMGFPQFPQQSCCEDKK